MYARAVLKFDFSGIPSNAKVNDAKLSLYFALGKKVTEVCTLLVLKKNWIENEVTWLSAKKGDPWTSMFKGLKDSVIGGGDYTQENKAMAPTVAAENWEVYTVTNAVQEMIKNPGSNFGFILQAQNDNKGRIYFSSNNEDKQNRPKLTITYEGTSVRYKLKMNASGKAVRIERSGNNLLIFAPFDRSYEVTMTNAFGQRVYSVSGSDMQWFTVPLGAFSNGLYLISIKYHNGCSVVRYFISD